MEDKEYENICEKCSKVFTTNDEDASICNECWSKIVGENEGEGESPNE